jgi:phospholipid transport system transporter-binding protein
MQLPQTLTLEVARAALDAMQAAADAQGGDTLAIDASALTVFDTAALALLLQARRLAPAGGRAFEVQGAPPKLTQLAQLYGVAELLGLAPVA